MSDVLPTVVIKTANGPVTINMSDFDGSIHELVDSNDLPPLQQLTESEITALDESLAPATVDAQVFSIGKNGKRGSASKLVVLNELGETVSDEFDTVEDAQSFIDGMNA